MRDQRTAAGCCSISCPLRVASTSTGVTLTGAPTNGVKYNRIGALSWLFACWSSNVVKSPRSTVFVEQTCLAAGMAHNTRDAKLSDRRSRGCTLLMSFACRHSRDVPLLCYALICIRSNQMAQHLATKAGFKKVWNVEGGLDAYAKQVDPSVGVY